jgi:hypothetical protein
LAVFSLFQIFIPHGHARRAVPMVKSQEEGNHLHVHSMNSI